MGAKKTLIGSASLKSRRGLSINEEDTCRDNLCPEVRSKINRDQKSKNSLKNVRMLVLSNAYLSMSTGT